MSDSREVVRTVDLAGLTQVAANLAPQLCPGTIVTLSGPMGAGKTTFVRALITALDGDPAQVASPTFALLHRYAARCPIIHVDAWRLRAAQELTALGFDELAADAIALIEWPERAAEALSSVDWRIELAHVSETQRQIRVQRG